MALKKYKVGDIVENKLSSPANTYVLTNRDYCIKYVVSDISRGGRHRDEIEVEVLEVIPNGHIQVGDKYWVYEKDFQLCKRKGGRLYEYA